MPPPVKTARTGWAFLAVAILTVLIISPVDAIPDWISGPLGFLDDLGYGILDIILLIYIRHKQQQDKQLAGKPPLNPGKKID